jgi:hypothetical protein
VSLLPSLISVSNFREDETEETYTCIVCRHPELYKDPRTLLQKPKKTAGRPGKISFNKTAANPSEPGPSSNSGDANGGVTAIPGGADGEGPDGGGGQTPQGGVSVMKSDTAFAIGPSGQKEYLSLLNEANETTTTGATTSGVPGGSGVPSPTPFPPPPPPKRPKRKQVRLTNSVSINVFAPNF